MGNRTPPSQDLGRPADSLVLSKALTLAASSFHDFPRNPGLNVGAATRPLKQMSDVIGTAAKCVRIVPGRYCQHRSL